jgi:acetate kinase
MTNLLVINSGSSSIKYQLFQMPSPEPVCSGLIERIGLRDGAITHKVWRDGKETSTTLQQDIADHESGMLEAARLLTDPGTGVLQDPDDVKVVGHRIVHGGETLTKTTIITAKVKTAIKKLFPLAPLHNPGHYKGIEVAEAVFKKATQVAVFDTAFHQTMPPKAYRYAIPGHFYNDFGIRVYGFHGTSHKYVSAKAMEFLAKPDARIISLHLGNGCSAAAIKAGRSLDTSMGLTPLDGLVMGTRCGNIDASVILYLIEQQGYTAGKLSDLLNKQSGMLGLTGKSDMRDIRRLVAEGNEAAKLAYELYAYRIQKYIGAYNAVLSGADAILFTGGVGEHDAALREMVCRDMAWCGIQLDKRKNKGSGTGIRTISTRASRVKVLVVPTNEELEIANQCMALLFNGK